MGLKKKFGWARFGPKGLNGAHKTRLGGFGPCKKIIIIIGSGPGRRCWPAGRVWVCKNPARTWPVAIPNFGGLNTYHEC